MAMKSNSKRPLSLAARVMLFVALAIGLCLLILGIVVQRSIEHHFAEQDAGELQVVADSVNNVLQRLAGEPGRLSDALTGAVSGHHGVYFQVIDRSGRTLYASPDPDLSILTRTLEPVEQVQPSMLHTWRAGGKTYRGAVLTAAPGTAGSVLAVAARMDFHLDFLAIFKRTLWAIMAAAGALTLTAAWFGVYQGHAPLRRLSDRILAIHSDQLHVRLDEQSVPVELKELVSSFNQMIGHLEASFVRLSNFSADIAHELRTPLTNLITQTQVGLSKARSLEQYRELLYSNLEEQERLAQMVSDMLWLAKTDQGLAEPVFETLDLAAEIQKLLEFFEALAEERRVALVMEGQTRLIQGDRTLLHRALSNLLSNAIRHTSTGGAVTVRILRSPDGVRLSVQNPGPDIPAEHLEKIFDRFHRVDPSRRRRDEGAGLGLSIVKSIADIHGGRVEACSGGGHTTFTLVLPPKRGEPPQSRVDAGS